MKKLKWGVIGAGGIADRRTLPGMMLAKNAELIAVMEVNSEHVEQLRDKYKAKYAYTNYKDLLANPEVEAVYIASPVEYHKEQAIAAAKAKKHILLEKPLAPTSQEAQEIVKVCEDEGVLLSAGFMMRFHTYHQKMKEIIQSNKIGDIVSCRAQLTCWYPEMPGNWRQQKKLSGGGSMMDMGVHCIDLLQYITGSKAKKISAFVGNKTFSYDVEDSASAILELENGAYCYVDSNFNIPDDAARCRLEFYGTKGSILAEGTIGQIEGGKVEVTYSDPGGYDAQQERSETKFETLTAELGNMYTKEIEAFGYSVLEDKPLIIPAVDAVQVQYVVEQAYESSEQGKRIDL